MKRDAMPDASADLLGGDLAFGSSPHAHLVERVRRILERLGQPGDGPPDDKVALRLGSGETALSADERQILEQLLASLAETDRVNRLLREAQQVAEWVAEGLEAEVEKRTRELRESHAQLLQAQKLESVGRLAGGVAHDFNNLLTVITGYAHLLERDLGSGHPGRGRLEEIQKAAGRASDLTQQLLAFSRHQVLAPRVLDLDAVVADLERMLRRLIGEDVEVVIAAGSGLGRVRADPGQLGQVILNLAVNARDAMPGGGRLIIETRDVELDAAQARQGPGAPPGRYVLLVVADTGHGMDEATLSRAFEPFFTTKEPGKGTGLGLATVYGIVRQSGGFVSLESEPGRGTTCKVYLPRCEHEPDAPPAAPPVRAARSGSETVLLIEDEAAVRALAREVLAGAGYRVLEAATPEEALAAAGAHPGAIHLVVTDVVLPGMSGPEVVASLQPSRAEAKVLFTSGYADDALGRHGVLAPGVQFLPKPFTGEALLRKVREALG